MFHREFLEAIDASAVTAAAVKSYISSSEGVLRAGHLSRETGSSVCTSYTLVIDDLIKFLFNAISAKTPCPEPTSLIAVGGYGRGELNIRSDIDLMLIYRKRLTPQIEALTQSLLYILWDTGLDLGFSIKSVNECVELAKTDTKTMTALLDRRLLLGDEAVYGTLDAGIRKKLFTRKRVEEFIEEKFKETRARHSKYGGSVYILEPNVKEGEGGLRDLHTARWIIKAKGEGGGRGGRGGKGGPSETEPFSLGLISEKDRNHLKGSLDFLLWVRNELHFSTGRKTDQLSFDQQERIALQLGFKKTAHSLAVESFMQKYYMCASDISRFSSLMTSRYLDTGEEEEKVFLWPKKRVRVDKDYTITGGLLALKDREALYRDPVTAIKAFEYSQSLEAELSQATKDHILNYLETRAEELARSKGASESFIKILRGRNAYRTLSEMHRLKVLERLIPEFAEISSRTQHDMYHIYTVDVHTLFAVRELERLRGPYKFDFSLHSTIFEELTNPEVLVLAVLLHDIGKAHGKGHADKGADIVPRICSRLNFPEDDANTVKFLVKNHLLLADTAQYRDLHDERLVIEFAKKVGDMERLNLLFLLTFADVRAVGPEVWSQWKGTLFQELYFKAATVLERGSFEAEDAGAKIERIKEKVKETIAPEGIGRDQVDEFFRLLPQRYFLSTPPDSIASHMRTLKEFHGRPYIMRIRHDEYREYTEIVIATHDVHGLFSMITGTLSANAVNILGAQINTLKNGIALDVLQVNSPSGGLIDDECKLRKIESDLSDVITGKVRVADLVGAKRRPSILDRKAKPRVPTRVLLDNEVSDAYTVLDIHTQNRIGLLYDITSTLSRLGLYIHIAKISTKGDEAADIFYIKDIFGQKIYFTDRLQEIETFLYNVLEGEGGGGGGGGEGEGGKAAGGGGQNVQQENAQKNR